MPSALPEAFRLSFAFAVGACLGSFLNVIIHRVPRDLSIVAPGSICPMCAAPIAWYDNIPLASFVALRARCRSCLAPISWRYPCVELAAAAVALAAAARFGTTWTAATTLAMAAFLIALSVIDLELWLLPSEITRWGVAAGIALAAASGSPPLRTSLIGALVGWAVLTSLGWLMSRLLGREAMGGGDPALLALIGAFLGWPALLPVAALASVQGAVVGLALLAIHGRAHLGSDVTHDDGWVPPRTAVPFGPFLAAGALEYVFLDVGRYDPLARLLAP